MQISKIHSSLNQTILKKQNVISNITNLPNLTQSIPIKSDSIGVSTNFANQIVFQGRYKPVFRVDPNSKFVRLDDCNQALSVLTFNYGLAAELEKEALNCIKNNIEGGFVAPKDISDRVQSCYYTNYALDIVTIYNELHDENKSLLKDVVRIMIEKMTKEEQNKFGGKLNDSPLASLAGMITGIPYNNTEQEMFFKNNALFASGTDGFNRRVKTGSRDITALTDIFRFLIEDCKMDVNSKDRHGRTLLNKFVEAYVKGGNGSQDEYKKLIQFCVNHGADLQIKNL